MFFPCFIPEYDAVLHARIIAKMDCSFLLFHPIWGVYRCQYTPFLCPLHPKTPPLHPCSDARNPIFSYPKTPFGMSHFTVWDVPFYHLGCPILPFGMSHFTIWGIPFHHLGYIFGTFAHNVQPRFSVCLLRFRCKSLCVSFLSVHHVFHDSFGWISQFL